jgi:hypothetical protein
VNDAGRVKVFKANFNTSTSGQTDTINMSSGSGTLDISGSVNITGDVSMNNYVDISWADISTVVVSKELNITGVIGASGSKTAYYQYSSYNHAGAAALGYGRTNVSVANVILLAADYTISLDSDNSISQNSVSNYLNSRDSVSLRSREVNVGIHGYTNSSGVVHDTSRVIIGSNDVILTNVGKENGTSPLPSSGHFKYTVTVGGYNQSTAVQQAGEIWFSAGTKIDILSPAINIGSLDYGGTSGSSTNTTANINLTASTKIDLKCNQVDVQQDIDITRALSINGSYGTAGQVLTSGGSGSAMTWSTSSGSTPGELNGVTPGVVTANKCLVVNGSRDIGTNSGPLRNVISNGTFTTSGTVTGGNFNSTGYYYLNNAVVIPQSFGSAGQALTVNSAGNAAEWADVNLGVTPGTVTASKAMVVDSNRDIGTIRNVTMDGTLTAGSISIANSNVTGLGTLSCGAITTSGAITMAAGQVITCGGIVNTAGLTTAGEINSSSNIALKSGGTVRMTIVSSNGRVGIGTATPIAHLDVNGSIYNAQNHIISGTVGVNTFATNSSTHRLHVGGGVAATGFTNTSDDRTKHNEENIINALSLIRQLNPQKYQKTLEMKTPDFMGDLSDGTFTTEAGFIAQEVMVIPDLSFCVAGGGLIEVEEPDPNNPGVMVRNMKELLYSLNYNNIFTYNVAATKELDTLVTDLSNNLLAANNRITQLENENNIIKTALNTLLAAGGHNTI